MTFRTPKHLVSRPSLTIFVTAATAALAVAVPAGLLGRKIENDRQFLKSYRAPFDAEAFFSYCHEYAADSDADNDLIFLGDSTCLAGVRTLQLQQATGLKAYNLGTIGMIGLDGILLNAACYLEHHPAPRLIVLCILPHELGPPLDVRRKAKKANAGRAQDLTERFLWCYGPPGEFLRPRHANPAEFYVSQGLLILLGDLRGGRQHYLNLSSYNLGNQSYYQLRERVREERGYFCFNAEKSLPADHRRSATAGIYLPAADATREDPFPISPVIDQKIRKLAELSDKYQARLMIRLSPELIGDVEEHFDRIRIWFDHLEADCPNVVCDLPEVVLYEPEYFSDENHHLNERGAERFTELLAASVRRALKKPSPPKSAQPSAGVIPPQRIDATE